MSDLDGHIDTVISEAVQAKIDAAVMQSLSGDEVFGAYVTAALSQKVEGRDNYGRTKRDKTFLQATVATAIQAATKKAVEEWLAEEHEFLVDEVRKALKRDSQAIATKLVDSLADAAEKTRGVRVGLVMPGGDW